MPSYFVTRSAFEAQLRYLRRHTQVLPLNEGIRRLRQNSLPPAAVSLTFDDGYANNLSVALPLLERYGLPATVFLTTRCVEAGEWYPFLKLKLVRSRHPTVALPLYKTSPVDEVARAVEPYWRAVEADLTSAQREALRPATISEIRSADRRLLDFGAHSHTHPIARNETLERRHEEVARSVQKVAEWTGSAPVYSYPNGEAGDFGEPERAALQAAGVEAAVSGIAGSNRWPSDLLALRRYPLTLHHDGPRFRAEATGVRTALLALRQRRHD